MIQFSSSGGLSMGKFLQTSAVLAITLGSFAALAADANPYGSWGSFFKTPSNPISVVHLDNPPAAVPTQNAAPASDTPFSPSPSTLTTSDSSVTVQFVTPPDAIWAYVGISKPGQNGKPGADNDIVLISAATPGPTTQKLYLQGEGTFSLIYFFANTGLRSDIQNFKFKNRYTVTNSDTRDLSNLEPSPDIQSDSPEILELALTLTQGMTNDHDKSVAIHDWVAHHISYDVADYFAKPKIIYPLPDAVSTLHRKVALCEGYANLNAALHRAAGIRAKRIEGAANPIQSNLPQTEPPMSCSNVTHSWNEVMIGSDWVIQDTTWDAGYIDETTHLFVPQFNDKYLFPTEQLFDSDHLRCEEFRG